MSGAAIELDRLRLVLLEAGWEQTSSGRWRLNAWRLETAYVWGEVTVTVRLTEQGVPVAEYRGMDPVSWVAEQI